MGGYQQKSRGPDLSQQNIIDWFAENPPAAKVAVDIGANGKNGSNTRRLINESGGQWRGVLVDPGPGALGRLSAAFNPAYVDIDTRAVSNQAGQMTLYLSASHRNHSLHECWQTHKRTGEITVEVVTLETILLDYDVPTRFGLLSVDTEGCDWEVIEPMITTTAWRPDMLIHEFSDRPEFKRDWGGLLEPAGYTRQAKLGSNMIWTYN